MLLDEKIMRSIEQSFGVDVNKVKRTLKDIIETLQKGHDLSEEDIVIAMSTLMSNDVAHDEIAAYLTALHKKGETELEVATSAKIMRIFATKVYSEETKHAFDGIDIIDCCGTGGGVNIFNISTVVAIILAAAGFYVAKHGNRAITSQSGSADLLEKLGVKIDIPAEKVGECILKNKIGFLFAPLFHAATKNVQQVRRQLKHKSIFNILGPLTNPVEPEYQLIGVYDGALTEKMARVLKLLGLKKACIIHGKTPQGGMDEASTMGHTKVSELKADGEIITYEFSPEQAGLEYVKLEDLKRGPASELAPLLVDIMNGNYTGPEEEIIALNTAFALLAADKVTTIKDGVIKAREIMRSGQCQKVINNLVQFTQKV